MSGAAAVTDLVAGQRGEVGEEAGEAVDGQTVVGEAEGLFGLGGGRACCFGDDVGALCGGGVAIRRHISIGASGRAGAISDATAEHAQEHMGLQDASG